MKFKEYLHEQFLNEASIKRLEKHINQHHAMLFISASRGSNTDEQNNKNYEILKEIMKARNFGYNKLIGGYFEVDNLTGKKHEVKDEKSLVVFAYEDQEQELWDFGVSLARAFDQDSFLFVHCNGEIIYYDKYGKKSIDSQLPKLKSNIITASDIEKYYSVIKGKKFAFYEIKECVDLIPKGKPRGFMNVVRRTTMNEQFEKYGYDYMIVKHYFE